MINCIALDDEPLALDLLEDNINKIPFLNLVKKCHNVKEAAEVLQHEKIDLIFLDIEMPGISGITFLKSIDNPPMVVFITAHEQYAVEGFEMDVLDYLLKPVSFERFYKAATKALEYFHFISGSEPIRNTPAKYIFVKADYKIIKINIEDILYIEGLKDYVKIHAGGKPVLTLSSLRSIESKLPPPEFVRVHRSFIVAVDKINSICKSHIIIDEREIPISDNYREYFFKTIEKNNL
ncbi:MAG: LytTR family DNA-binding domain-containing protein [Bacteroidota bacterium]